MLLRQLSTVLLESLSRFPVVFLGGARQVGKSTLAQSMSQKEWPAQYLTLDERTVLDAALTDPDGLLQAVSGPAVLDEVQRAPDLLRAVKVTVDRNRKPGMFLLTGSANVLTMSRVSETLAGRVAVHELNPFSWTELKRLPASRFVEELFESPSASEIARRRESPSAGRFEEIQDVIMSGGYPTPALMDSRRGRRTWFDSYRQTYIERDVRDVTDIAHVPDFNRLLSTLALRTGHILNISELSRQIGLPYATLRRYLDILIQTYQVFLLRPYFANIGKRLVKTPKVYLTDTGMACHLSMTEEWRTLMGQNRAGAMLETWVACELRKLLALAPWRTELWYFRTRTGREVDFLLERSNKVIGIEVKLTRRIKREDLAGLHACRQALGRRYVASVLLHTGTETVAVDRHTLAVPIARFFGVDE